MEIGLIGLGRMGAGVQERLRAAGHTVVGFDQDPARSEVDSPTALIEALAAPRVLWLMLPAGDATQGILDTLAPLLRPGDTIIDGGNAYYRDSQRRAQTFGASGIEYVDAGVSGGVAGAAAGYCVMVGGADAAVAAIEPLLIALAVPHGYAHVGASGAGQYVKMVHNGIEYGMLQAYAEGFDLLRASDFELDLAGLSQLWNQGSVIRSWLLELAADALTADPALQSLEPYVDDSGEGRWTVQEAVDRGVPAGVLAQALFSRFASRDDDSFALRFIAALRREFGGHATRSR